MHYCPGCNQVLLGQFAHCHHYGCGWQNPNYVAQEMETMALASGNPDLAVDIALMNGDVGTAVEIEIMEDLGGW